jgi:Holliday junction resolvase RusA-like endonuclease
MAAEREIATLYRLAARSVPLMTGTVCLSVEAVFGVPRSWSRRLRSAALAGEVAYTGKPDKDNIEKLVMDALNGVAWVDDCQVDRGPVVKRYGVPERIEVTVEHVKAADGLKTPAELRREAKVASGMVGAKRPKRRSARNSTASELLAIGKRLR